MSFGVWLIVLLALSLMNYAAARLKRNWIGRVILLATSLPALVLTSRAAARLGYAIINAEQVDAAFQAGDLTYFGADMAFVVTAVFCALWVFVLLTGFRWGRRHRRPQ